MLQLASEICCLPFETVIEAALRKGGYNSWLIEGRSPWLYVRPRDCILSEQGWKLHVSAHAGEGMRVLQACLPVLLQNKAIFKCCESEDALGDLNQGKGGLGQIGKFLTIYPANDEEALTVAEDLYKATDGIDGPLIRNDCRLKGSGIVYYRYGGFSDQTVRLANGLRFPAISDPHGRLIPDFRNGRPPEWAKTPFPSPPPSGDELKIPSRFVLVQKMASSPHSVVALALDVQELKACVVKAALRGDAKDSLGTDAFDRLRVEASVLKRLDGVPGIASVVDYSETDSLGVLVLPDYAGGTLADHVQAKYAGLNPPSDEETWRILESLAGSLHEVHQLGLVFRDLKPTNVVLDSAGCPVLIDFGCCVEIGYNGPAMGSVGFMSPEQMSSQPADPRDDVYALGAVAYYLATSVDPARIAKELRLPPVRAVGLNRSKALGKVIEHCLAKKRVERPQSMRDLLCILEERTVGRRVLSVERAYRADPLEELRLLVDAIGRQASTGVRGVEWPSADRRSVLPNVDINAGTAGTILALADAAELLGRDKDRRLLSDAAESLLAEPDDDRRAVSGLMVGECGVGFALLRANQILKDYRLPQAAIRIGEAVFETPHHNEDLFCGTAGRIKYYLHLQHATAQKHFLDYAVSSGDWIVSRAIETEEGGVYWNVKSGIDEGPGEPLLGYAHGIAGIGDALLDLYDATREDRFRAEVLKVFRLLTSQVISLGNDDCVGWPVQIGDRVAPPYWCHGAGGISRFIMHVASSDIDSISDDLVGRLGSALYTGSRGFGAVLCHGISGTAESLLDLYEVIGDPSLFSKAVETTDLLHYLRIPESPMYVGDGAGPYPDFMIGYAGIASLYARIARDGRRCANLPCDVRAFQDN